MAARTNAVGVNEGLPWYVVREVSDLWLGDVEHDDTDRTALFMTQGLVEPVREFLGCPWSIMVGGMTRVAACFRTEPEHHVDAVIRLFANEVGVRSVSIRA